MRFGGGEREGDLFVDMVETESVETDRERRAEEPCPRFLPRSSSFLASISSAIPFLRKRSLGTSVVSCGFSFGFKSCCVRDGRGLYGRSWADALHS